jgi:6-phosphogluconolactonase
MHGETCDAEGYEAELRGVFGPGVPVFDLVLQGLGDDGHTASLFPGTEALEAGRKLVAANYIAKFSEWRITLTYRALNEARRIVFVVAGKEKASAAAKILRKERGWRELPASRVCPGRGSLLWLLDEAAASKL